MYERTPGLRKEDHLNIFVEYDLHLTPGLPTTIGRNTIAYLDFDQRVQRRKKLGGELRLTVMRPMKNKGSTLVFNFVEYLWNWNPKRNATSYALSDGCKVELIYDCEKKRFVVDKVEIWGV
jgi:hypothetical protein